MFVIFCSFFRNFCLIPAHLPYVTFVTFVTFFLLEAAHNQREIPTFCRSFPVDSVFQSCSHMGGKEAAAMKADSKVLRVILESHEKNQNGVSRIASELFGV